MSESSGEVPLAPGGGRGPLWGREVKKRLTKQFVGLVGQQLKERHGVIVNLTSKKDVSKALRSVFPEHAQKSRENVLRLAGSEWGIEIDEKTPDERKREASVRKSASNAFLGSAAWRSLRYRVLRSASGRCAACGVRAADGAVLHVDHIKPRLMFPELALEESNLQVLCEDCNLGKGADDSTDWRQ